MKILVADDDPCGVDVLAAVLRVAGHQCVLASDGHEAWDILQAPSPPQIAFLDWMMPGIDGLEVCRKIRERGGSEYTYVIIVSARNKQQDIISGFQSGADDFITKPYKPEDILARVRVAERLHRSFTANSGLPRALAEARESPSGDVIVRTLRRVGRIIFHDGRIAWAHVSDEPGTLATILAGEPDISRDDVRAVLAECKSSGQNFADVLVSWNLLPSDRLRVLLRDWIRAKIATIAAFPLPVVLFSPESRVATGGILFDPAEVLPPEIETELRDAGLGAANESPGPAELLFGLPEADPPNEAELADSLDRALAIDGASAVTVFDLRSGRCLGKRGAAMDLDLVWSQLRLASQNNLWDELEDILISTHHASHLVRWYTRTPPRLIFLTVDRSVTLGLARHALRRCLPAR